MMNEGVDLYIICFDVKCVMCLNLRSLPCVKKQDGITKQNKAKKKKDKQTNKTKTSKQI